MATHFFVRRAEIIAGWDHRRILAIAITVWATIKAVDFRDGFHGHVQAPGKAIQFRPHLDDAVKGGFRDVLFAFDVRGLILYRVHVHFLSIEQAARGHPPFAGKMAGRLNYLAFLSR